MAEELPEQSGDVSAANAAQAAPEPVFDRPSVDVDIACVGFGPATAGFLTTLSRGMAAQPELESKAMPGFPPQVVCYERADDVGFGVSGVVTRARAIRASFPDFDPSQIPMAAQVTGEKLVYMLDPVGASRRGPGLRAIDTLLRLLRPRHHAVEIPWIPEFLRKDPGFVLSLGQFNQWVAGQLLAMGNVQVWPATPVAEPLVEDGCVRGVRLMDQGTDREGRPESSFVAGMDVRAALTVIGDGPVGAVSQQLDRAFGLPEGNERRSWALGMKMVVDLPQGVDLEPGTVFHTIGFPEPEIFGFFYVHPDAQAGRVASVGIFVPSSFDSPVRTAWRYLQHYMQHPYLWRYLQGGKLRSWGAKSLDESGRNGEPLLALDGCARIGEGSGTTNVLTGSGVDEAWYSGVLLAEAVLELWQAHRPFTRDNLDSAYVARRRASWLDREARAALHARQGFERGFFRGLAGMALAGFTKGRLHWPAGSGRRELGTLEEVCRGKLRVRDIAALREDCQLRNTPLHDSVMRSCGWPEIPYDGALLLSLQDALLLGGKVQAPVGYKDHVCFRDADVCRACEQRTCVEMCSGEAIHLDEDGLPGFDRDKCVHCGACVWNCTEIDEEGQANLVFGAGAGGLHSAEN